MLGNLRDRMTKAVEDAKSVDLSGIRTAVSGAVGKGLERVQTNFDALMEDDERVGRGTMALVQFEHAMEMDAAIHALNAIGGDGSAVIVPGFENTVVFRLSVSLPMLSVVKPFKPKVLLV